MFASHTSILSLLMDVAGCLAPNISKPIWAKENLQSQPRSIEQHTMLVATNPVYCDTKL